MLQFVSQEQPIHDDAHNNQLSRYLVNPHDMIISRLISKEVDNFSKATMLPLTHTKSIVTTRYFD